MKDLSIKVKVPENKVEAVATVKKYWSKLDRFLDKIAEILAKEIKEEVKKHDSSL